MTLQPTAISGVFVVETELFQDARGEFYRAFSDRGAGLADILIRQINVSQTRAAGTIRGLHYQPGETKLVRCLRGRIWDVALDLRRGSPTFLRWHSEELSSENRKMLVIPPGCAHGFQALEKDAEMLYLHTELYDPQNEGGVRFDDPAVSIGWPLHPGEISRRDQEHSFLAADFPGL